MANVDAVVNQKTDYMRKVEKGMESSANAMYQPQNFSVDPNLERTPLYKVYIFNIARKSFDIRRPPLFRHIVLKACPPKQKYICVGTVNDIVNERWVAAESGQILSRGERGERIAMDLINPANTGIDQNTIINDELTNQLYGSDNLGEQGLFFSRDEHPTDEEIAPVRERMEKYYRRQIQAANVIAQDQKRLPELTPEHHLAADYFNYRAAWHTVAELPETCPNCGDEIKPGLAYHTNANGRMCILDWRRSYESGAVKKEDVPEEKKWWTEKK